MAVLMDPLAAAVLRDALEVAAGAVPRVPEPRDHRPWRFRVREGAVEILTDPAPTQETLLSCGAALLILRLAIGRMGYRSDVAILADEELATPPSWTDLGQPSRHPHAGRVVARLEPGEPTTTTDSDAARLLAVACEPPVRIAPGAARPQLPQPLAERLVDTAAAEGGTLTIATTVRQRRAVAAVLRRSGRDRVGAPLRPDVADVVSADLTTTVPVGLSAPTATPAGLVRAGAARERVLLMAALGGWSAAAVTQPFGRDDLARALGTALGADPPPQALLLLAPHAG